jgi:hypothetical protein
LGGLFGLEEQEKNFEKNKIQKYLRYEKYLTVTTYAKYAVRNIKIRRNSPCSKEFSRYTVLNETAEWR